jgi:hypothetical protein
MGYAYDRVSMRRIDSDGRLHVRLAPITRTQVAAYVGREIPDGERYGLDPNETYMLYRSGQELEKAVRSACGLPILARHVASTADNHPSDLTIGCSGNDAIWDPPFVRVSLTFWDGDAIAAIEDQSAEQISSGYRYVFDPSPGSFEGVRYDGVMRDIEFNHAIICPVGRAGPTVMVHDQNPQWLAAERYRELKRRFAA